MRERMNEERELEEKMKWSFEADIKSIETLSPRDKKD